ncbi:MAG: hypothetical protein JNM93_11910 [Bacteriovoracaceae bacterium]|nr:hypothetical protein [Bacteriovoracaceae bacterium]
MKGFKLENGTLQIEFDANNLAPQQIRIIKTINSILHSVSITDSEEDYFEACAELMKQVAAFVKQAKFNAVSTFDNIPYAEQALEYSMDEVREKIFSTKLNNFDN